MEHEHERSAPPMEWPGWATWAVVAIILSSIVTIAATINAI